jgi:antitoxin component of RelBE/YafQ-DinJ toxin-antitoxin module
MKARLNITIDNAVLEDAKAYATKQNRSVSDLVETYFKKITKPAKRKSILDLVEKLEKPDIPQDADLKELYYKENAKKYGF